MIPTYGGVLSAIEKALRELMEEYQGVGTWWRARRGIWPNWRGLGPRWSGDGDRKERAGKRRMEMMWRGPRMAPEKVRRRGLRCPPPVSILVLFFLFNRIFFFYSL